MPADVTVFVPIGMRPLTAGQRTVSASGRSVAEVIKDLEASYPGFHESLIENGASQARPHNRRQQRRTTHRPPGQGARRVGGAHPPGDGWWRLRRSDSRFRHSRLWRESRSLFALVKERHKIPGRAWNDEVWGVHCRGGVGIDRGRSKPDPAPPRRGSCRRLRGSLASMPWHWRELRRDSRDSPRARE